MAPDGPRSTQGIVLVLGAREIGRFDVGDDGGSFDWWWAAFAFLLGFILGLVTAVVIAWVVIDEVT